MKKEVLPTKNALKEALDLSCDILKNIELSELPIENIALKTARLTRLLNDFTMQKKKSWRLSLVVILLHLMA